MAGFPRDPNAAGGDRSQSEQIRRIRTRRPEPSTAVVEHGFSITGPLYDLGGAYISPWVARHDCTLTEFSTEGPHVGTCDVYWYVLGGYKTNADCPLSLTTGDSVRIELDPTAGSETITGMFKIEP